MQKKQVKNESHPKPFLSLASPTPRSFAPLWEVFRISSDKLALCHAELVKKLQDLIKEISRYGDEQLRAHKKVSATLTLWNKALRAPALDLEAQIS